MDLQLKDHAAIVFGGGGGIGCHIARVLGAEGARVAIADRDEAAACREAERIGGGAFGMACDLSDRSQVRAAVDRTVERFGRLQICVQSVGLTLANYLPDISDRDVDITFSVNMRGSLWVAQAAVEPMRQGGYGRLVFIGSGSGMKGSAGLSVYSASKFFIRGLAQAVGLEVGPAGVTCNVVCPSDVYPEGDAPAQTWQDPTLVRISCEKEGVADLDELRRKRIAKNPLRRACTVQDVASLTAFLCSPLAGFINAQTIGLNGGGLPT
ncbi:MAG TPA: SDR family oxidoreductase [Phycisphaerae bacterium]|nr:SDR family oxidoreductase [Phycisphaerae bacterium]HOJ75781.1 SDR family oxidoreductase [Phycisphaerae bacterium]HOM51448.1 SDR family oxidoreductase [Phycisphaerae bacterium]HON68666.1 SDR family oxidoreductase [Phycisphaerae bacterium]HOQ86534.1 SDR family oxidoreductase [Phycisphaerae bacterium]